MPAQAPLVVNDGAAAHDPRFKVVREARRGPGTAVRTVAIVSRIACDRAEIVSFLLR